MSSPASPSGAEEAAPATPDYRTPLALFAAATVLAGVLAAGIWRVVVRLPGYLVQADGSASVTERALTEFFAVDAWFVFLGAVTGAGLGVATWRRFKSVGWPIAFLAAGLGLLAGVVCWQLGGVFGGVGFDERLAAGRPGDLVPIGLELRSPSALAVWAFAAVTPILLGSALGPDEEAPPRQPRRRSRLARARADHKEVVDDLGVVRPDESGGNS